MAMLGFALRHDLRRFCGVLLGVLNSSERDQVAQIKRRAIASLQSVKETPASGGAPEGSCPSTCRPSRVGRFSPSRCRSAQPATIDANAIASADADAASIAPAYLWAMGTGEE